MHLKSEVFPRCLRFTKVAVLTAVVVAGSVAMTSCSEDLPTAQAVKRDVKVTYVPEADFRGEVELPGGVTLKLTRIKAGSFMMGSPAGENGERGRNFDETLHAVTLTQDYWLGTYEITQAQYKAVVGSNPSNHSGDELPVERISWRDAKEFCDILNSLPSTKIPEGFIFDLPTEAQWEYACRAGSTTPFAFGKSMNGTEANCNGTFPYGSEEKGPYARTTTPVGSYKPNAWGLYDMHGNVWEWCRDRCEMKDGVIETDTYKDGIVDPMSTTGSRAVYRGGSWYYQPWFCRSANRSCISPDSQSFSGFGFRVALVPIAQTTPVVVK